jgi:copper chaperone
MSEQTFSVPTISCGHCVAAISESVCAVAGVTDVDVDLAAKTVRVAGTADPVALRAAIADAGYDAA